MHSQQQNDVLPVHISGRGCISAAGDSLKALYTALRDARCHLRMSPSDTLPLSAECMLGHVKESLPELPSRSAALALYAARAAILEAGLSAADVRNMPLVLGTSTAGMPESEGAFITGNHNDPALAHHSPADVTRQVASALNMHAEISTHSVACASAAWAIIEGMQRIRSGENERVLVIGTDALCRTTIAGFQSLKVFDVDGCNPLCDNRAGMSIGEGAGALILEHPRLARLRPSTSVRSALYGWGATADAHHATTPHPEGTYLRQALHDACTSAGIHADDISYINAHGTGTLGNDRVEAETLHSFCAGCAEIASSKHVFGHCMGAAAAIEAIVLSLAIEHGTHFANACSAHGTPFEKLSLCTHTHKRQIDYALSSTLAFGGNNVALILGAIAPTEAQS